MWPLVRSRFRFLELGPFIDRDLELVAPEQRYIDDVLAACRHAETIARAPDLARISRQGLYDFLDAAPFGHHSGEGKRDSIPSYHFWMKLNGPDAPLRIAGSIALRVGDTHNLRNYIGHVGYNVYPPAQGRHLAERSARLLFPLARQHGLKVLWITCNPDNWASRRTCERLGATFVDEVPVPPDHELFARGEIKKCRFRIEL